MRQGRVKIEPLRRPPKGKKAQRRPFMGEPARVFAAT